MAPQVILAQAPGIYAVYWAQIAYYFENNSDQRFVGIWWEVRVQRLVDVVDKNQ